MNVILVLDSIQNGRANVMVVMSGIPLLKKQFFKFVFQYFPEFSKMFNIFSNISKIISKKRKNDYAHMLIVVAFLVVQIFVFWVITRHHDSFEGCH